MDQDLDFKVTGELEEWKDEDGWSGNDSDQLDIDEAEVSRDIPAKLQKAIKECTNCMSGLNLVLD